MERGKEGDGTFEGDMDAPTIHKYTPIHADYMYKTYCTLLTNILVWENKNSISRLTSRLKRKL